ncbi:nucleolar protein 14 homolog [Euwallacea fornicatus]|uniref:nucleolar protein 14 homolog n=1 Tax=Euwallacea fornicatus TaxID=995702 RepID=UPI00338F3368
MAKVKNRKRVSVDQIHKKRQNKCVKKALNPFEVHINKEKMRVLGKKQKNDKGLPGISRAKAILKRKHTLLNEYKLQHKTNKFVDRRIGEKGQLPNEDKIMARFAALRAKAHNKKSIFNLAEDEVLTHRGQTLSEIEKFEDPQSDDEESDDENKGGKLGSSFVEDVHFGGGVLSNTGQEGVKTHKQLIEQLIEESKKRKAEKQKIKEATLELTEKLDTEWKDLVQLVSKSKKTDSTNNLEKPKLDDYDKVMRELRFEAKGTVSDKLKTEDEIAKEEKEKLEKLENERLERMRGGVDNNSHKSNHRSADDLDDDFVLESDEEKDVLTYDEHGQSNVQIQAELNGKLIGVDKDNANQNNIKKTSNLNLDSDQDGESSDTQEENEEFESEDSLADLKDDDSMSDESDVQTKTSDVYSDNKKRKLKNKLEKFPSKKGKGAQNESGKSSLTDSEKKELEKAGNELPFTFKLPESYESFIDVFQDQSSTHQKIILERMIKCNHPSLSQGNKDGLGLLFAYILQYINDLFTDENNSKSLLINFQILSTLMVSIFELAQLNKENTHNSVMEVIKEKHQEFRKRKKKYPGMEVPIFLKLVSVLFSTSDFRHQVVTPCFIFMEQMLTSCRVRTAQDISYGLFICTLVLEYTSLSNRYLPAAINFLSGIFHMCIPKSSVQLIKVVPPFKPLNSHLVLTKKYGKKNTAKHSFSHLLKSELTEDFKVSALNLALKLLKEFQENLKNLPSCVEIFTDIEAFLNQIPVDLYPCDVQKELKGVCDLLKEWKSSRKLIYLIVAEKKPKALRLYEPKIVDIFDGKRRKVQSREKSERDKLIHKLKKETKGALREIRRDKAFLGRVKINQRIQSDKQRKEKVNKIYAEAASQQSELNALDKKKKRK